MEEKIRLRLILALCAGRTVQQQPDDAFDIIEEQLEDYDP